MKKGWLSIVPKLVRAMPGLTAEELAEHALRFGAAGSDSETPVRSLANTLHKHRAQVPGIVFRRVDGALHYFPAEGSSTQATGLTPRPALAVSLTLSPKQAEAVEALIESGRFTNRTEATRWLLEQGIAAKGEALHELIEAAAGVRKAREALRFISPDIVSAEREERETLLALDAQSDPVLAELWDNQKDAAYDQL